MTANTVSTNQMGSLTSTESKVQTLEKISDFLKNKLKEDDLKLYNRFIDKDPNLDFERLVYSLKSRLFLKFIIAD